jgi:sterol 3beta-glucosyltransferase
MDGYWFSEPDANWQPPQDLAAFLAAGPPPVYIGFGSMSAKAGGRAVADRLQMLFEALERAGQRGIISVGENVPQDIPFPSTVFRCGSVPHDWLFPRVSMTVHHGGSGTTAQSLRAGVPMLVTPFMWDQPFWGRQVAAMGLGPQPIPHKRLNADNLAAAIRAVVLDRKMQGTARAMGERVRHENGVERAVAVIEERLRSYVRAR